MLVLRCAVIFHYVYYVGTTIKLQDGNEFEGHAGKGINRTALVPLQSMNGNDMSIRPVGAGVVSSKGSYV